MANVVHALSALPQAERAAVRYGVAALLVGTAYALQLAVWPFIPPSPHLLFYPAVFVAARLGGRGPGYFATALAAVAIAYGFLPPEGVLAVDKASDVLDLAIFGGVGVGISFGIGQLRAALAREKALAQRATKAKESTDATWSMMAHDLRQPLNVITLGSSQLGRRAPMPPEMEETLGLIKRSTERARVLLDDALDAMRATEGKLVIDAAECDARELCAHAVDAVSLLAKRKGVTLECDVSTRGVLMCDQPRMEQVLANLLGNAVKFTPKGGVVSLYVDESERGFEFSVRDTGRGIPQEELESIFTKFWTASSPGGTGLGLWIACAIVEAHGAHLSVQSSVGVGTTFLFTLPRRAAV